MLNLNPTRDALNYIRGLEPKQFKQVMNKVLSLLLEPTPADSCALKGHQELYRVDFCEHRIVYRFDEKVLSVLIVDKRNDDEVYKKLSLLVSPKLLGLADGTHKMPNSKSASLSNLKLSWQKLIESNPS